MFLLEIQRMFQTKAIEMGFHPKNYTHLPSLDSEKRKCVPTDVAAFHLGRKPQTLRVWACMENGPIRPARINGRLAWSVAAIRELLQGDVK